MLRVDEASLKGEVLRCLKLDVRVEMEINVQCRLVCARHERGEGRDARQADARVGLSQGRTVEA